MAIEEIERKLTVQDLDEMMGAWLEGRDKAEHLKAAKDQAEALERERELAPQYESIISWQAAVVLKNEAYRAAQDARARLKEAETAQKELERRLVSILPAMVWIRRGDVGIGVAYTDWGGSQYYLTVAPWQEQMPSLDHTHRGD